MNAFLTHNKGPSQGTKETKNAPTGAAKVAKWGSYKGPEATHTCTTFLSHTQLA